MPLVAALSSVSTSSPPGIPFWSGPYRRVFAQCWASVEISGGEPRLRLCTNLVNIVASLPVGRVVHPGVFRGGLSSPCGHTLRTAVIENKDINSQSAFFYIPDVRLTSFFLRTCNFTNIACGR